MLEFSKLTPLVIFTIVVAMPHENSTASPSPLSDSHLATRFQSSPFFFENPLGFVFSLRPRHNACATGARSSYRTRAPNLTACIDNLHCQFRTVPVTDHTLGYEHHLSNLHSINSESNPSSEYSNESHCLQPPLEIMLWAAIST